jgi:excinuclease ABC subunit C
VPASLTPEAPPPTDLKREIDSLPAQPGVYLFRDAKGDLLYVGKAKRLDQRVRSHFQDPSGLGPKQVAMVRRVAHVEFITVDSEIDALLLEATLVREQKPPYNVHLKDDKRYPYVRVSWEEAYPRVSVVRHIVNDGARYFGPYTEVKSLRQLLRLTQNIFPMRSCRDIDAHIAARRECLDYHIGRCTGPCIAAQSLEDYRAMAGQFCDFLAGRRDEVLERLRDMLRDASERREYERAAKLRDRIRGVESILARQRMVDVSRASADVMGLARDGASCCVVVFRIRERRVVSRDARWLRGASGGDDGAIVASFLPLYYNRADALPEIVIADVEGEERSVIEGLLTRQAGRAVRVRPPRDPAEQALVRAARRNAALLVAGGREKPERGIEGRAADEALELQRVLALPRPPRRIRCFDVSQLFGTHAVASMVTFLDGRPLKGEYRRYRIRTVEGQHDYDMLAEALGRHAKRVGEGELKVADLVVIDGGIGQLHAAGAAVRESALHGVPMIGLAKRFEEIVRDGRPPVQLSRRSPALHLLQRVRDEAHRFAITYHRALRGRGARDSRLDKIPGLGPKRRALLLQRFGSVERLRRQPISALTEVPGIGPSLAERILSSVGAAEAGAPGTER